MKLKTDRVLYLYDEIVINGRELSPSEIADDFKCCIESVYNYISTINYYLLDRLSYSNLIVYSRDTKKYHRKNNNTL